MNRDELVDVMRRALKLRADNTTDMADAERLEPAAHYTDPERFARERAARARGARSWSAMPASCPKPGSFVDQGRHGDAGAADAREGRRGARIPQHLPAPAGSDCDRLRRRAATGLPVPLVDLRPRRDSVVGVPGDEGFTPERSSESRLPELPADGVRRLPLGGARQRRPSSTSQATSASSVHSSRRGTSVRGTPVGEKRLDAHIDWKLALDTFAENYHFATVHATTFATVAHSNCTVFDSFGPHHRLVFPLRAIDDVADVARGRVGAARSARGDLRDLPEHRAVRDRGQRRDLPRLPGRRCRAIRRRTTRTPGASRSTTTTRAKAPRQSSSTRTTPCATRTTPSPTRCRPTSRRACHRTWCSGATSPACSTATPSSQTHWERPSREPHVCCSTLRPAWCRIVIAVGSRDGGITFADLDRLARNAAARICRRPRAPRRVGYVGLSGPAFHVSLFAAAHAGVPAAPLNYRLSDDQLADLIGQLDTPLVVADEAYLSPPARRRPDDHDLRPACPARRRARLRRCRRRVDRRAAVHERYDERAEGRDPAALSPCLLRAADRRPRLGRRGRRGAGVGPAVPRRRRRHRTDEHRRRTPRRTSPDFAADGWLATVVERGHHQRDGRPDDAVAHRRSPRRRPGRGTDTSVDRVRRGAGQPPRPRCCTEGVSG